MGRHDWFWVGVGAVAVVLALSGVIGYLTWLAWLGAPSLQRFVPYFAAYFALLFLGMGGWWVWARYVAS